MLATGIAMWASVLTPNTKYQPVYEVQLIVSEEEAKKIKSHGIKVQYDQETKEYSFRPKRNLHKADGTMNPAPSCVDADKMPLTQLIGNGSKVNVQYHPFEWNNKFGKGMGADFAGIQVLELIPYKGGDGDEFDVVEGGTKVLEPSDDDLPFDVE